ncbi:MAG: transcriptional repressor [Actinobacteria bacterium]|nr:transcriptional repressor [Actinomycetota bacterium]
MNQKIDNLARILIEKKIKPSYQRIKVLQYINENINHPTVDSIFNSLIKEIPTLSKATVYNTLELFKDANLAKVITIEDNETRYDSRVHNHGHFKCESCGSIYDFEVDIDGLDVNSLKYFKINEKNVYFKGICPKCLNKNKNQQERKK